jgi:tyrosine aminotransferase
MSISQEKKKYFTGSALGLKNWVRITFAIDIPSLVDAFERIKSFCQRHGKLET